MAQSISAMEDIYIATIVSINQIGQPPATDESIMIDSGAATHVSPPWFGTSFPLHQMRQQETRQTHLEDSYRNQHLGLWVSMDSLPQPTRTTHRDSILRLWCEATHPISHQADTSRLWDQHEWAVNNDKSQVLWKPHRTKGWTSLHRPEAIATTIRTTVDHQEWWRRSTTSNDSTNTCGHIRLQDHAAATMIIWTMNNQGFIVRIHKRLRRALFTPFNNGCPINTGQLEDYRKTIIRQPGKEVIIIARMTINRRRGRIRAGSQKDQHGSERHGLSQKHQHQEAACLKRQCQDRSCKSIRKERQISRREKRHRQWDQQQDIQASNHRSHQQTFQALAITYHHQTQQTRHQTIGFE